MQSTVRTTIRLRKDLFDQTRLLALKRGVSLQDVINNTLALGFGKVSDLEVNKSAMAKIDKFRFDLSNQKIDIDSLLASSKADQK